MAVVFVAGYFDGLHSGHVRFLQDAAHYGRVVVGLGCDARLRQLKGRDPLFCELERLYVVQSCKYVDHAFIMPEVEGDGGVVWERYLDIVRPDYLIANDDIPADWRAIQQAACERHGVKYLALKRTPPPGMAERTSSQLVSMLEELQNGDTI